MTMMRVSLNPTTKVGSGDGDGGFILTMISQEHETRVSVPVRRRPNDHFATNCFRTARTVFEDAVKVLCPDHVPYVFCETCYSTVDAYVSDADGNVRDVVWFGRFSNEPTVIIIRVEGSF